MHSSWDAESNQKAIRDSIYRNDANLDSPDRYFNEEFSESDQFKDWMMELGFLKFYQQIVLEMLAPHLQFLSRQIPTFLPLRSFLAPMLTLINGMPTHHPKYLGRLMKICLVFPSTLVTGTICPIPHQHNLCLRHLILLMGYPSSIFE